MLPLFPSPWMTEEHRALQDVARRYIADQHMVQRYLIAKSDADETESADSQQAAARKWRMAHLTSSIWAGN